MTILIVLFFVVITLPVMIPLIIAALPSVLGVSVVIWLIVRALVAIGKFKDSEYDPYADWKWPRP